MIVEGFGKCIHIFNKRWRAALTIDKSLFVRLTHPLCVYVCVCVCVCVRACLPACVCVGGCNVTRILYTYFKFADFEGSNI